MKAFACLPLLALAACAVGPDYVRPEIEIPSSFKEAAPFAGEWQVFPKEAATHAATAEQWWLAFADPVLDGLMAKLDINNQNIRIAEAQYQGARAAATSASAAFYPALGSNLARTRSANPGETDVTNTVSLSVSASWELDAWGRIRRSSETADARLDASAADLAAARLSAQALLAQTYIQLRGAEAQVQLLTDTVAAYTRYHQLIVHRHAVGMASPLELSTAESQLATARASLEAARLQRTQFEHALATLLGQAPATLSLTATATLPAQPPVPPLVPSLWLTHRPDLIAAERRVAAANAQIGVASAAWFPSLTLAGNSGYRNESLAGLIASPNRFWSFGPALALTLFDGGARSAAVDSARAGHAQAEATYRQAVLTALQEVEDNLAAAHLIDAEKQEREIARKAAQKSRTIAGHQYEAGTSSQLELATAEANALAAERTLIEARQRHLLAAVQLYKNLGGRSVATPQAGK